MKNFTLKSIAAFSLLAHLCTANTSDTETQNSKLSVKNNTEVFGNSFGVYGKLGFLGYEASAVNSYYTYINYTFTPGLSFYYSYRANNGVGVEAALEYEYNMHFTNTNHSIEYNFFTPAIYFSWLRNGMFSRIGIGYDIGLPYNFYGSSYTLTYMYHGVAILASDEWKINNNNAIGIFAKVALRWLNIHYADAVNNISGSDFNHVLFSFGLSYRFNIGF